MKHTAVALLLTVALPVEATSYLCLLNKNTLVEHSQAHKPREYTRTRSDLFNVIVTVNSNTADVVGWARGRYQVTEQANNYLIQITDTGRGSIVSYTLSKDGSVITVFANLNNSTATTRSTAVVTGVGQCAILKQNNTVE